MFITYQRIFDILNDIISKTYNITIEPPILELAPNLDFGDLSSPVALKLSSKIKKSPLEIASFLKSKLETELNKDLSKIDIVKPGFINIFISKECLISSLIELIENQENFFKRNFNKKILLEFVSANPTGPLSIAHGRQAVVGDVIGNILKFYGNNVIKEYYINDEGEQIKLLISSVKERIKELKGEPFLMKDGYYLGEYIRDIAKDYLKSKSKNLKNFVISYILRLIKKDLSNLGVKFDSWVSQKKIIENKEVDKVIALLKEKNLIYEQDEAIWFASTKFGDDKDRVVRKKDLEYTYFASDIGYHFNKFNRGFDEFINIWGPDHHGYINRIKSAIEALGYNKDSLRIVIVQLTTLKSKEKMSKRKGNIVLVSDLTKSIGKDPTRFYYLLMRNSSHLEFDIDLAKELSFNNPFYYIQYASARIESIFRKAKVKDLDVSYCRLLNTEDEINYIRTLLGFSNYLDKAYYTLEPIFIIEFLKKITNEFHKFYEKNKVLVDNKNTKFARLNLLKATKIVLDCAFNILGIKPFKKM